MKNQLEIEDRLRTIFAEELDRRVQLAHKRLPQFCTHYHPQPLDTRPNIYGEPNDRHNCVYVGAPIIGLCMYGAENPETWHGTICEDALDAQRCQLFTPCKTVQDIWFNFCTQTSDEAWMREHMPEAYALQWVLSETKNDIPWWKRLWWRLLCIRPRYKFEIESVVKYNMGIYPEQPKADA